jgi:hypothetical protein
MVGNRGSSRHFNPFYGIHDQQPQLAVKVIQTAKLVKASAGKELMVGATRNLKGPHVRGKAKKTDGLKKMPSARLIANDQPATLEQDQLFRDGNGWLSEGLQAARS